ncbi:MAG: DNA polymerase Y family protein [Phycisphaerales bacterium]
MPRLPIDLLRRREKLRRRSSPSHAAGGEHVLVVGERGPRRLVVCCCERASDAGVEVGMPAAQARAVLPAGTTRLVPEAPERVAQRLRALAVWARRFSPLVQTDGDDGLWLDITGCAHLFGGEDAMATLVIEGLAALGISARAAIADTRGCAWALARFGNSPTRVVPPGEQRDALAPLPVAALGLDTKLQTALSELAIDRIEHLLDIPRKVLPSRFGASVLLALDSAMGHAMEVLDPVRPVAPCRAERMFDGYTTSTEAIELATRELLDGLATQLLERGRGARRVVLELVRYELASLRLSISLAAPSNDPKHLWTLLRPKLERAHLGFGVEGIRVTAPRDALLGHEQAQHWRAGQAADDKRARLLIDVLSSRLGETNVRGAVPSESHLPERAFVWTRPMHPKPQRQHATSVTRPTVLLEPPVPTTAIALTPDGPVHRIRWKGQDLAVVACRGPERIAGEWWRGPGSTRDYFRVRCEGGVCLWVARSRENGSWYVHGWWA